MDPKESEEYPYISVEKQKFAPYKSFKINLSRPIRHQNNNTSQFNPFCDIYKQLGIKRPNIANLIKGRCLKIGSKNEENEIQKFYERRQNYVGSRFLDSLQNKNYYPIARKSVILHESHKVKNEINNISPEPKSKFDFLYENFHQNQSTLQQLLTLFPNRPNDFTTQFGLKLRTDSQDKFLERLYMLNFDVLISSYYLLRNIDNVPPLKDFQIDIMKCRSKPLLPPNDPLQSNLPKDSIGHMTSDIENVTDILDFNLALKSMRTAQEQVKRFTKPISSRNTRKVLMSSTPSSQGFISIYERDRSPSDAILRADIFSFIGIRIRRNQKQEHIELTKNEIGWSQERIPTRRMLLTSQEMFFERRKAVALAHSRSGSNSSFSSIKSFSSQISQASQMSQSSTNQQTNPTSGSSANAPPIWNREESSNPFTSQLFKDQIVRAESKTVIIENAEAIEGSNGLIENENDSESDSSFF